MVRIRIVGTEIGIWSQKGPIVECENSMMLIVICSLAGCGRKKKAKGGKKKKYLPNFSLPDEAASTVPHGLV